MKTIQRGILHFLTDHMDFNHSLYYLSLNVFKLSDLPPGPIRESVAFHEFSHGILCQNIMGRLIFSLFYVAYDSLSYCAVKGKKRNFLQTWPVFKRCRDLAAILLDGWRLTQEGYACLMGLKALRHWNQSKQTQVEAKEKKQFEKLFWQQIKKRPNIIYKKAIDLYEPFRHENVEETNELSAIADAASSIFPGDWWKDYLRSGMGHPEETPDQVLASISAFIRKGLKKIPQNIDDALDFIEAFTNCRIINVRGKGHTANTLVYDVFPFLYLELDWPRCFKERGERFLRYQKRLADDEEDKVIHRPAQTTKITRLPSEVLPTVDEDGFLILESVIRCNNPSKEEEFKTNMQKLDSEINTIMKVKLCTEIYDEKAEKLYQELKELNITFPEHGLDMFFGMIPAAAADGIRKDDASAR